MSKRPRGRPRQGPGRDRVPVVIRGKLHWRKPRDLYWQRYYRKYKKRIYARIVRYRRRPGVRERMNENQRRRRRAAARARAYNFGARAGYVVKR